MKIVIMTMKNVLKVHQNPQMSILKAFSKKKNPKCLKEASLNLRLI